MRMRMRLLIVVFLTTVWSSNNGFAMRDNAYRELRLRIAHHVHFLAAHVSLADSNRLILPSFFLHPITRELVEVIGQGGASHLRDFWKREGEYVLNTDVLCREFIFLLVALYHNLACSRTRSLRGIPWLSLAALYMRINAIPLNKLFDILDECLAHYQSLLQEYSVQTESTETLAEWFTENWWLPAIMLGMAAATLVRWLRGRQVLRRSMLLSEEEEEHVRIGRSAENTNINTITAVSDIAVVIK